MTAETDVNLPEVVAEVTDAFNRYEQALVANDLDTLANLFWASKYTLRFGEEGSLYGHDAIVAFRAARPSGARPRKLLSTVITTFGHNTATANAEFQNENETRIGRQSQTWVRMLDGWCVIAAHVSYIEPTLSAIVNEATPNNL